MNEITFRGNLSSDVRFMPANIDGSDRSRTQDLAMFHLIQTRFVRNASGKKVLAGKITMKVLLRGENARRARNLKSGDLVTVFGFLDAVEERYHRRTISHFTIKAESFEQELGLEFAQSNFKKLPAQVV